ncbi:MAG: NAD(P)-binding protein, partial [Candidatus Hermodarchaeota archaeon]
MRETTLDRVEPSDYDAIVAGGGAGGLLTSLALTAEGKRVLVLDQATRLGGVWHGYWVDDFRV